MTREETIQLLMTIQAAFPNYKVPDKTVTVNIWMNMLENYDSSLVMASLKSYIATDKTGFAPSIGQIIDKAHTLAKLNGNSELTETEAWSLVSKALRNGVYNSESEFNKLPESVQKAVGSHEMLRVWATDENFNESVVSSNFMRSYKSVMNRKTEIEKLPASVVELIQQKCGDMALLEGI